MERSSSVEIISSKICEFRINIAEMCTKSYEFSIQMPIELLGKYVVLGLVTYSDSKVVDNFVHSFYGSSDPISITRRYEHLSSELSEIYMEIICEHDTMWKVYSHITVKSMGVKNLEQ